MTVEVHVKIHDAARNKEYIMMFFISFMSGIRNKGTKFMSTAYFSHDVDIRTFTSTSRQSFNMKP